MNRVTTNKCDKVELDARCRTQDSEFGGSFTLPITYPVAEFARIQSPTARIGLDLNQCAVSNATSDLTRGGHVCMTNYQRGRLARADRYGAQ